MNPYLTLEDILAEEEPTAPPGQAAPEEPVLQAVFPGAAQGSEPPSPVPGRRVAGDSLASAVPSIVRPDGVDDSFELPPDIQRLVEQREALARQVDVLTGKLPSPEEDPAFLARFPVHARRSDEGPKRSHRRTTTHGIDDENLRGKHKKNWNFRRSVEPVILRAPERDRSSSQPRRLPPLDTSGRPTPTRPTPQRTEAAPRPAPPAPTPRRRPTADVAERAREHRRQQRLHYKKNNLRFRDTLLTRQQNVSKPRVPVRVRDTRRIQEPIPALRGQPLRRRVEEPERRPPRRMIDAPTGPVRKVFSLDREQPPTRKLEEERPVFPRRSIEPEPVQVRRIEEERPVSLRRPAEPEPVQVRRTEEERPVFRRAVELEPIQVRRIEEDRPVSLHRPAEPEPVQARRTEEERPVFRRLTEPEPIKVRRAEEERPVFRRLAEPEPVQTRRTQEEHSVSLRRPAEPEPIQVRRTEEDRPVFRRLTEPEPVQARRIEEDRPVFRRPTEPERAHATPRTTDLTRQPQLIHHREKRTDQELERRQERWLQERAEQLAAQRIQRREEQQREERAAELRAERAAERRRERTI